MPKYKIGIIKRQVIEKRWEVEIEAPTLTQAAENAEKAVDEWIKLCN